MAQASPTVNNMSRMAVNFVFATCAFFAMNQSSNAAATITTIRVGYPQLNGGQVPLWNIPENKLDQKYGLDVKPVYIPDGVRLTQSALSGAVGLIGPMSSQLG